MSEKIATKKSMKNEVATAVRQTQEKDFG